MLKRDRFMITMMRGSTARKQQHPSFFLCAWLAKLLFLAGLLRAPFGASRPTSDRSQGMRS